MKHLGDITKISGKDAPVVNVVIGGSPCQDLSIAGKRKGLAGERSGLFMEQIRIIKEMREKDAESGKSGKDIKPRFMVWENVPGAFSSNKGRDFGAVLEETIRVVCEKAPDVPVPKNGWPMAGCIYGENGEWSVAWRVFDAQFWGVPQRRRRIALVADFGGLSAPEVLFERESVSGRFESGGTQRESSSPDAERRATKYDPILGFPPITLKIRSGCDGGGKGALAQVDKSATLSTLQDQTLFQPFIILNDQGGGSISISKENVSPTLCAEAHNHEPVIAYAIGQQGGKGCANYAREVCPTILSDSNGTPHAVAYCIQGNCIDRADTAGCNGAGWTEGKSYTLNTIGGNGDGKVCPTITGDHNGHTNDYMAALVDMYNGAVTGDVACSLTTATGQGACNTGPSVIAKIIHWIVRRLTPLECERLQGFPDGWTDIGEWIDSKGKVHKDADTPRYKALGNSIALPSWYYVLFKLSIACGGQITMASLFDGIGGFPLLWETINGSGTCLWASEIEEFPIAVTKKRFGENMVNRGGQNGQ